LNPVLYRRYIRVVIEKQAQQGGVTRRGAFVPRRINDYRAVIGGFVKR